MGWVQFVVFMSLICLMITIMLVVVLGSVLWYGVLAFIILVGATAATMFLAFVAYAVARRRKLRGLFREPEGG